MIETICRNDEVIQNRMFDKEEIGEDCKKKRHMDDGLLKEIREFNKAKGLKKTTTIEYDFVQHMRVMAEILSYNGMRFYEVKLLKSVGVPRNRMDLNQSVRTVWRNREQRVKSRKNVVRNRSCLLSEIRSKALKVKSRLRNTNGLLKNIRDFDLFDLKMSTCTEKSVLSRMKILSQLRNFDRSNLNSVHTRMSNSIDRTKTVMAIEKFKLVVFLANWFFGTEREKFKK